MNIEQPERPPGVDRWITIEEAQARGLHLVCTDPAKGTIVHVGDVITHTATGADLMVVEVLNDYQALARTLRARRRLARGFTGTAITIPDLASTTRH